MRAELGTRARFSGTLAKPRKRVNGKVAAEVSLTTVWSFDFFSTTSEGVKTFFFFLPIFSGKNTNCLLARGKIWQLILADFGTQTEKGRPSLV